MDGGKQDEGKCKDKGENAWDRGRETGEEGKEGGIEDEGTS